MNGGIARPGRSSRIPQDSSLPAPPEVCPVCGEEVPQDAAACPGCGADHDTGWNEEATAADGLDLPDDDFNYDEFVKREFGEELAPGGWRRQMLWIAAGLVALLALTLWLAAKR